MSVKPASKFKKIALYSLLAVAAVVFAFVAISYSRPEKDASDMVGGGSNDTFFNFDKGISTQSAALRESAPPLSGGSQSPSDNAGQVSNAADRKITKDGSLEILVNKTEEAAEKIKSVAAELGGFTDGANIYNVSEDSKAGTVTIRIPAAKFDEAISKLKALAIKVDKEEITATDVTAEFTDLEAWLKSFKAEEAQYLKILSQAKTVEDTVNVAEHLSNIRSDIERLQGRIKFLSSQVDMSSISVSLTEEGDVQLFGIRWRPLFVLKQAFRDMLKSLSGFVDAMINLILLLPVLALWLAVFIGGLWVAWKIFRFVKEKLFTPRGK